MCSHCVSSVSFYLRISSKYELALPLFDRAEVQMGDYKLIVIAENLSPTNRYVKRVLVNDVPLDRTYITHDEIANGGTLKFEMGPAPPARK